MLSSLSTACMAIRDKPNQMYHIHCTKCLIVISIIIQDQNPSAVCLLHSVNILHAAMCILFKYYDCAKMQLSFMRILKVYDL